MVSRAVENTNTRNNDLLGRRAASFPNNSSRHRQSPTQMAETREGRWGYPIRSGWLTPALPERLRRWRGRSAAQRLHARPPHYNRLGRQRLRRDPFSHIRTGMPVLGVQQFHTFLSRDLGTACVLLVASNLGSFHSESRPPWTYSPSSFCFPWQQWCWGGRWATDSVDR